MLYEPVLSDTYKGKFEPLLSGRMTHKRSCRASGPDKNAGPLSYRSSFLLTLVLS